MTTLSLAPAALAVALTYTAGAAALWVYAYVTVSRSVRRIEGRLRACPARAGDAPRGIWRTGR